MKAAAFTRTNEVFGFIPCGPMSQIREREAITDLTSFKECDQKSTLLAWISIHVLKYNRDKIFNITIFSFCESNNPPYKIFSLCENSELHWNLWIFWSYSLWANVSGQRSRSDYWTDYIQGMEPKFQRFPPVLAMIQTSSDILKRSCLHHLVLKASSAQIPQALVCHLNTQQWVLTPRLI